MESTKAITHIPGWMDQLEQADKVTSEALSYKMVPLVFRAIRLRANSLIKIPFTIYNKQDEPVDWIYPTNLKRLLWKTEAALLLSGAAYWLRAKNNLTTKDLIWVNPFSMEVSYSNSQYSFMQYAGSSTNGPWSLEDVVYFREFDPLQDTHPGTSAASVTLGDAQLRNYITRYAYHFFDGGAMPVTLMLMENISTQERDRAERLFKRMVSGVKNAFRVVGLRGKGVETKTLTPPMDTLALPELNKQAKENVANGFEIPITMLEEPAANRATADIHYYSYMRETVRPRAEDFYQDYINEQVLYPLDLELRFEPEKMDIFQVDEAERAGSLLNLVQAGIPAGLAMEILGYDLTDEQRVELGLGVEQPGQSSMMGIDLDKWRRKAVKRYQKGYKGVVEFESFAIPGLLHSAISGAMEAAKSPEDIEAIFADPWMGYP